MHIVPVQAAAETTRAGGLMSRLLFFTVLGFLTLVLFGPVVALLSAALSVLISLLAVAFSLALVALPFALIGLVAWGAIQGMSGSDKAGSTFAQRLNQLGQSFLTFFKTSWTLAYRAMHWTCVKGMTCLTSAGNGVRRSYAWTQRALAQRGRDALRVVFEAGCGALIGTVICLAASGGSAEAIPFGVIGGILIGGAAGWPKAARRQAVPSRPMPLTSNQVA